MKTHRLTDIGGYSELSGSSTLFDSIMVIENYPLDNSLIPEKCGLSIGSYSMTERTHYDLTIQVLLFNDVKIDFHYNPAVIDAKTVARLAGHYESIIAQVLEKPTAAVSDIGLFSDEEKKQVLMVFNETGTEFPSGENDSRYI